MARGTFLAPRLGSVAFVCAMLSSALALSQQLAPSGNESTVTFRLTFASEGENSTLASQLRAKMGNLQCSDVQLVSSGEALVNCTAHETRRVLEWSSQTLPFFGITATAVDAQTSSVTVDITSDASSEEHDKVATHEFFFILLSFILGALSRRFLRDYRVPYTVLMYGYGFLLGVFSSLSSQFGADTGVGIAEIDPELTLLLFLPVLLFESAFSLPLAVFRQVSFQALLLAGPGCLVFALLYAVCAVAMYPNWAWAKAVIFGAIVSATDPVAVVALLKELGASRLVSTLIEGESLVNDAGAIVMFDVIKHGLVTGSAGDPASILVRFVQLAIGGPIFGWIMGRLITYFIKKTFNDSLVEVTATISGAYLTYYIGQELLQVSGVLAIVAFGLVMNSRKSSISPEVEHFMHAFWEIAVYFANTLIFMLVGLETFNALRAAGNPISSLEPLRLLFFFVMLNVVRFIMVFAFLPAMNRGSVRLDWRKAVLVVWSGLRGAVGLALALDLKNNKTIQNLDPAFGPQLAFHVSGIVLLTILVNGVSTQKVVSILGLAEIEQHRRAAMARVFHQLRNENARWVRLLQTDSVIADADWDAVYGLTVSKLRDPFERSRASLELKLVDVKVKARVQLLRGFRLEVWKQYREGVAQNSTIRRLVRMADTALVDGEYLDVAALKLCMKHMEPAKPHNPSILTRVLIKFPLTRAAQIEKQVFSCYDLGTNFIHAVAALQERLDQLCGERSVQDEFAARTQSAMDCVRTYMLRLAARHPEVTLALKTRQAARTILNADRRLVEHSVEQGLLEEEDALLLVDQIEHAMMKLDKSPGKRKLPDPRRVLFSVEWFRNEPEHVQQTLAACELRTASEGQEFLFDNNGDEDGTAIGLALIVKGVARLTSEGEVDYVGPGRCFNAHSILTGEQRREVVYTQSKLRYYWFPREVIVPILEHSPTLQKALWRSLGIRMAYHVMLQHLPYALWGKAKTKEHCENGWILDLHRSTSASTADLHCQLWPQYEYVLLHGEATVSESRSRVAAPALLQFSSGNRLHAPSRTANNAPVTGVQLGGPVSAMVRHDSWVLVIPRSEDTGEDEDEFSVRTHDYGSI
eukprot:TRINITY_DN5595_c0_g1_i1.p1 TRINITY_DN5595_c0_g1~~TRINITY_DN5595_c0_g1_i1.p1  ORF type:complete len:1094 (+),score=187.77 TRINITY_DN5595_c0_g1_i1:26-3307(+)